MKIMVIEDDERKSYSIVAYLESKGISGQDILRVKTMTDFAANLGQDIGLFIIDIRIPSVDDAAASQNGSAILEAIVKAGKSDALLLALSSYPEDFPEIRKRFEKQGCILADFRETKDWQSTLDHLLIQLHRNLGFDFLIFCALQEERNPYVVLHAEGKPVIRGNLNCFDLNIGDRKGSVVLLPKMGLVNAAVIAAVAIERFKPSVVAMSGICGGFPPRAKLGQLFVSEMAYEYQSGKWSADGFLHEPYQVPTDQEMITFLESLVSEVGLLGSLEQGFTGARPSEQHAPALGIFTSGSAVIASKQLLDKVEQIHRKVHALDMEVFAIQRAAQLAAHRPVTICAKAVVDLCDSQKGDQMHPYGSYISAKFVTHALQRHFAASVARTN